MPIFGLSEPAAFILVACTTGVVWTLLVLLIRLFIRCKINGPLAYDDYACSCATVGLAN